MPPVITVENLSKSYLIGHQGPRERYQSLRDTVAHTTRNFARKAVEMARGKQMLACDSVEEFWALKDVSFEIEPGEVLGIIGRNGAGKSTLLKILSRITEPTQGKITLKGRVASLLEVGTGFHPELTGRENIYLNGAILGMPRSEIKRKFDEIVEFAEVEKFLDTPVKRYSSGMYVRLAFSVAAHMDPEILIVDEVLAVGDATFQKKCLGKMGEVSRDRGRTVLFVSHNISAITNLCTKAIVIEKGRLTYCGEVPEAIGLYLSCNRSQDGKYIREPGKPLGKFQITSIQLNDPSGKATGTVNNGNPFAIRISYQRSANFDVAVTPSLQILTASGIPIFQHHSRLCRQEYGQLASDGYFDFQMPKLPLPAGTYLISVSVLGNGVIQEHIENAIEFTVVDTYYPDGQSTPASHGLALIDANWRYQKCVS